MCTGTDSTGAHASSLWSDSASETQCCIRAHKSDNCTVDARESRPSEYEIHHGQAASTMIAAPRTSVMRQTMGDAWESMQLHTTLYRDHPRVFILQGAATQDITEKLKQDR